MSLSSSGSSVLPFLPFPSLLHKPRLRCAAVSGNRLGEVSSRMLGGGRVGANHSDSENKAYAGQNGGLEALYDDGFGDVSVKDYFDAARAINKPDGGAPRWFCPVECGAPIKGSPLLLFLPGADGVGMGLILHHKSLGKVFEVRCLHIPVNDRTPFEGLLKIVDNAVKNEHSKFPHKPIYIVGESFGGCLALAAAACNPDIDLVLVLVNPATSFGKSQLQPIIPLLEALPRNLHATVPYFLSLIMGDPVKMAMASVEEDLPLPERLENLSNNLTSLLPLLSDLGDIIPKDTLLWKLRLLKSGSAYVNSRLHAISAEVLVLASGKDNLLPSGDEADRLWASLKNCRVRYFKDSGHTLLLEEGINLLNILKGTITYRRSRQYDTVTDYLPPSLSDFRKTFSQNERWYVAAASPVMLSTLEDGRIVRGLAGVPDKGPLLLVGNHMILGLELRPLYEEFLKEKKVIIRGMAHPFLFSRDTETPRKEISINETLSVFGATPVTPMNMYRLFSKGSFILLYPGGAREALHRKGEEHKLFWPNHPEFVRMAARFGATIVPFGVVGEDDLIELVFDYNDLESIPFIRERIEELNKTITNIRINADGEVSEQPMYLPGFLPKLPGRLYYHFGKPIETRGLDILKNKKDANALYLCIKSEIEGSISYLKQKREGDPYRSIVRRILYQASFGSSVEVPTFEP
ncbi:acyltransferase-like protein At1g54570, chloroplastic isoform X3 [Zingiber officinale]|uniref:acyltransferase-like protein At1g54570, chloroplastic isoform X3 n=1 Tax=Zingiber officinale TaxID=94328 RepID=UPI001C4BEB31|nr:acyltransferase-like protein At1g54570, chloroplastic isoform X3 [Zingiber officinale]